MDALTPLLLAAAAATGTYLLVVPTSGAGRRGVRPLWDDLRTRLRSRLDRAGLDDVGPMQFAGASIGVGAVAAVAAVALFGAGAPALLVGLAATCLPAVTWRRRVLRRRRAAQAAWPRLIEELRVLTGSAGRSVPQALLEVGRRGPEELQPAFRAAQREWALSTDLERMLRVLKDRLDDPTADAACETLLVAAEVGGDLDGRLAALAEDRRQDLAGRRDADAKQAGARFARAFVLLVPAGMAVAGLSVGDGGAAYRTGQGQLLVVVGLVITGVCWWWSGRIMQLPEPERVFDR